MSDTPAGSDVGALDETIASDAPDPRLASDDDLTRATVRAALFGGVVPPRLGKYRVVRELGRGGLGVVYLAEDPELGREVAIKVLRTAARSDSRGQARMAREARALAALSHPNVVHVYEIGSHDDRVFVAMEFVSGQTLSEWLHQTKRGWREVVELFVRAGRGLEAAHDAGLVHRDFKPDNVLVGTDGRPRVVDFGLARADALVDEDASSTTGNVELTAVGAIVGTPAYMAPEQFESEPVDARTDQFSFCVALFEALYRERPFAGDTIETLSAAVLAGEVVPLPEHAGVPDNLRVIVLQGLRRAPSDRFENMALLLEALQRELDRGPRARRTRNIGIAVGVSSLAGAGLLWALLPEAAPQTERADDPEAPAAMVLTVLTKTPGGGTSSVGIDRAGEQLAYVDRGGLWLRAVTGGVPTRANNSVKSAGQIAFGSGDGTLWATDATTLWRVDPTAGAVTRVADGVTPAAFLAESTRGEVAGLSEAGLWRVSPRHANKTRSWPNKEHPTGLAWSPDGTLLMTRSWPRGSASEVLRIFDGEGEVRLESEIPASGHEGLAWFDEGPMAMGGTPHELAVRCIRLDLDSGELEAEPPSRPVAVVASMARAVASTRDGNLLLSLNTTQRDVLVGDIGEDEKLDLERISPKINAENHAPTWVSPNELAFVSSLHLRPSVVTFDVTTRAVSPPAASDGDVVALAHAGPDRRLTAVAQANGATTITLQVGDRVTPIELSSPHDAIESVHCMGGAWCAVLRNSGRERWFELLDLATTKLTRGVTCPPETLCLAARVSLAEDHLALVASASLGAPQWLDLRTGDLTPTPHRVPENGVVQSAALFPGSDDLLATILFDDADGHGRYVIARLTRDRGYQVLWSSEDTWVVGPVFSPSGTRVAVTGLEVQAEAALLSNVAAQCGD